jgi:predicted nucleic acid-binding protein
MYLLDTNIVSELRRKKPHGAVVAWLQSVDDKDLYLSSVTLAEIQAGIEITRDQDIERAVELEAWLDEVATTYNILDLDGNAFRAWAKLMHKKSDTLYEDGMIAAIAKVNKLIVVTRNVTDFESFDVKLLNPFEYKVS